jgi:hypothetical protein
MLDTILVTMLAISARCITIVAADEIATSLVRWVIRDEANSVLGPRSTALDAERKRLSEELQSEPPAPKEVALHPAILKR